MSGMTLEKIQKLTTVKECETLAANAERLGKLDFANAAYNRAAELRAEKAISEGRRPDIDYHYLGLVNGDVIELPGIGVSAEVFSNRTLSYKGREVYITPLEEELMESGFSRKQVVGKWVVRKSGKVLNDLYVEKHGPRGN